MYKVNAVILVSTTGICDMRCFRKGGCSSRRSKLYQPVLEHGSSQSLQTVQQVLWKPLYRYWNLKQDNSFVFTVNVWTIPINLCNNCVQYMVKGTYIGLSGVKIVYVCLILMEWRIIATHSDCSLYSERSAINENNASFSVSRSAWKTDQDCKKVSSITSCQSKSLLTPSQLLIPYGCSVESRRDPQVHAFVDEDNKRNNRILVE